MGQAGNYGHGCFCSYKKSICDALRDFVPFLQFKKRDYGRGCFCSHKKSICDALRDFVPFVKSKKREKHPWRSVTFSKVAKVTLLHGCFSHFLNCTNGTKSRKASHMERLQIN